ncbi:sulfatase-like hydrolase/transferase [Rubinisphaera margarita]|uniref:sulfatase-like hydrolase/transferase n=1 Tax=Rubinisphaera margarita TaxID=2909586 RepID=UPI001EE98A9D|nr:sulfatase-like hydrolase/transferase [Rubinisphaera margarita]MCG6158287.1 sulfatase-like hydrolase/transferase [Rubinisphaera margarita]
MKKIPLLFSTLLGLTLLLAPQNLFAARPNLIVVMVDDMGYEGVSCFGNPYFETPEIDRLAAEGMKLTDFHSSGTVCSPTRAGLLTGRYQQRTGIEAVIHPVADHPEHRKGLQLSETTFAEVLKEQGYSTGLIGKWHQGYPHNSSDYHPQHHGFDEFIGYHSGNIDFVSHVGDHNKHDWWHGKDETREEGYSTHLINKYTLDFVRRHADEEKPFCLYVAHEAIHNPVQVPGDAVRRTEEHWDRWKWKEVSEDERIAKYKGMTMPIDEGIGQLRQTLLDLDIAENTFVLFFSDNGPSSDFPSGSPELRGGKGTVFEGGHKVPAIAWWPGTIEAGSESDQPMISIDVMPTLLSLAGAESSALDLDGVDLSPVLLRDEQLPERPLYWASMGNNGSRAEAMRSGPWKLTVHHPKATPGTFDNEAVALFHLENDPGEKNNVVKEHPETARKLLRQLKNWYDEVTFDATPQIGGWIASTKSETPLIESTSKETVWRNRDGKSLTWFHPRACMVPEDQKGEWTCLMNLQEISGSDYFGQIHWSESKDAGKTWSDPEPIEAFGRIDVPGHPGLKAGVCDVTPQYHPQTKSVIALGHVVFYRGPRFARGDQLARYPVYAVRRPDGSWSERKILEWDNPAGSTIYTNGCGQRIIMPNGDVMLTFSYGDDPSKPRKVAGVRCSFDGEDLKILEVGPPLENSAGRGLLEPSITRFNDKFYMTIRAEDGHGYVAVSDDGVNYRKQKAWAFDDGESIGMSTTQQHWLTHSDGLFLVYNREDETNKNVMRWRSPLWVAQVDPEKLCLIRETEQVVLPLVGDGIDNPDEVALMGNFDVTNVSPFESIVTVGEWMPRRNARGDVLIGRIRWSRPNKLFETMP